MKWAHFAVICAMSLGALAPVSARAQATSALRSTFTETELGELAKHLGSNDPQLRASTVFTLSHLEENNVPEIAARVTTLSRARPLAEDVVEALGVVRRAAGSTRADDDKVDLAAGVVTALTARHDANMLAAVEPLLLLRSLESIGTEPATRVVASILALDGETWSLEAHRVANRMGAKLLPFYIVSQFDPRRVIVRWAKAGLVRYHGEDPQIALQSQHDPRLLADMFRAYGTVRSMEALRVIGSYLTSDRVQLRDAARATVKRYGRNAYWVLYQTYSNAVGRAPDANWSTDRIATELYREQDAAQELAFKSAMERVRAAHQSGQWNELTSALETADAGATTAADRDALAKIHADIARTLDEKHNFADARSHLLRASWLVSDAAYAKVVRKQLAATDAELALSKRFLDLDAFAYGVDGANTPEHVSLLYAQLSGEAAEHARTRRKLAAALASVLIIATLIFLRRRGSVGTQPAPHTSATTTAA